jgi:hypothetical protein
MKTFKQFLSETKTDDMISETVFLLDESVTSKIDQWINSTLAKITGEPKNWDKMSQYMSVRVQQASDAAPKEPVPRELIDKILSDEKIKKEMERLALERQTTVEKIKSVVYAFGGKFVERAIQRWKSMSAKDRRDLVTNTLKALMELVLIILKALAKSKR